MSVVVEDTTSSSRRDYTVHIVVVPVMEMMFQEPCHRFPLCEKLSLKVNGWNAMAILDRRVLAYINFFKIETRNIIKPVTLALGGQVCQSI